MLPTLQTQQNCVCIVELKPVISSNQKVLVYKLVTILVQASNSLKFKAKSISFFAIKVSCISFRPQSSRKIVFEQNDA